MLSEPNYKLLKPVLVFNNALLALFYIFILLPYLFGEVQMYTVGFYGPCVSRGTR